MLPIGVPLPISASGIRLLLESGSRFPFNDAGSPVSVNEGGPVYLASAVRDDARIVEPCKVVLSSNAPKVLVTSQEREVEHNSYYYLLPFHEETMKWVLTSEGQIPKGWSPIKGGFDTDGEELYHILAKVDESVWVPGMVGSRTVSDSCTANSPRF